MTQHKNKPMVLLGYSRDIMECCKINNGQEYLFGRRINGFVNDRAAFNLSKKENKTLDYKKTHVMNITFEEGANKLSAFLAREEFHSSTDAKSLPDLAKKRGFIYDACGLDKIYHFKKNEGGLSFGSNISYNDLDVADYRMRYFRGVTEDDGINGVMRTLTDFKNLGINPLYKPSGTGQGKGIIGYNPGELEANFKHRFYENLDKIKKEFGKGAGYPFLVMPVLNLAKTDLNEVYDMRFVIYKK
ncbi:hypothetical protein [Serratia symbiotica]|nr:hypothetical protein [Serratia symbiotica]